MKYFMRDLICDVISFCVSSFNMGNYAYLINYWLKTWKKKWKSKFLRELPSLI